jgi:hypothetical protein
MRFARARKAIVAALGTAVTLVLLVPEETIPERWRPWVGVILGLGTVAGVYRVRNDLPTRDELLRKLNNYGDEPRVGGYPSGRRKASEIPPPSTGIKPPRQDDVAGPPRRHLKGDRPVRGDDPPSSFP